jgi:branched-chain amino acid transport system ATP-binding protein
MRTHSWQFTTLDDKLDALKVMAQQSEIGEEITNMRADQLVARGIGFVPQSNNVFPSLTIEENLQMGAYIRDGAAQIQADIDRIFTTFPRLKERRSQLAGTLSGGEQQMLAMGRALMAQPQLLLLDEPSMGLSPLMVDKIFEVIQGVAAQGMTVLLVEQNARRALQIADRAYVMESGLITLSGAAKNLLDDPKVRAAYLGE